MTAAASEADTEARIATAHVLPPRLGSRAAVRVPSAGNPPAITAPAVGTVASGANIVIARRKRPAAVIYSTDQTERESSATARRDISGPRKETYYSHPGNYDMYNAPYDDYPAPTPQSIYNSAKASSMFYHGGGGHFLRETDSYLYEEEYMVPHFDSYANNYLSKRRRFGVGDVGYDYGADSISRTEELLSYEMPASHSPYYITAPMPSTYHYSDDYVMPPMYPRGSPASSDHNLSRTTPVTSQFGDYTKSDQSFSASTAHWPPEPAPILPEPVVAAAPAPEPKKLDPNDLFALLSANGLF